MAAQIISLAQRLRPPPARDWSSQEVAEFYRVESALLQAGLALESERGVSDEGDPWFVFCRQDTGEVFIHFARVDGEYVVDGAAFPFAARGRDFGALVRDLIGRHPLAATRRPQSNVFLHPAALLIALVGAAFFQSGHAKAAESGHDAAAAPAKAEGRRGLLLTGGAAPAAGVGEGRSVSLDAAEVAAILTGVAIGLRQAAAAATPASSGPAMTSAGEIALASAAIDIAPSRASETLSRLSAVDTRAALTVMAAFADMAVVKAAHAGAPPPPEVDAPAAAPVALIAPLAAAPVEAAAGAAPPIADAPVARPMLLVSLTAGALPEIAAVALVAADGALAYVDGGRAVHVDVLPKVLSDLIARGEIVNVAAGAVAQPAVTPPDAQPAPAQEPQHPGAHDDASPPPPPPAADHDPVDVAPTAPVAPVPAPPPEATAPPPPVPTVPVVTAPHHNARIDAAILDFVTKVAKVQMIVTDREVVFYDPNILGNIVPGDAMDSITWKLEDGSSVSLVGMAHDLHGYHGIG